MQKVSERLVKADQRAKNGMDSVFGERNLKSGNRFAAGLPEPDRKNESLVNVNA